MLSSPCFPARAYETAGHRPGNDEAMTDEPVDLDTRRGMAAQKSTEIRRHLQEVQADQAALRQRQEEFETMLLAEPAKTWPEAAAKAQYLIHLFAETQDAQDPRRKVLITNTLLDLTRLSGLKEPS
jgi:hypothetical protein